MEELRKEINALESAQLTLQQIMASSDAHAAKCAKLGLTFADEYPEECAAYTEANSAYNVNETELATLKDELAQKEAEAAAAAEAAGEDEVETETEEK